MDKKEKKLVLSDTPIKTTQLLRLLQVTPKQHRFTRPAKGGGTWDYVTGAYVKQTLNEVFGWLWSFDIISIKEAHGQAVCQGKLTINKPDGTPLVWKTDIGKADIKYKSDYKNGVKVVSDIPLDYGNDEKASATDCLKRCAFQLGIASDIYDSKKEFQELKAEDYLEVIENTEISKRLDDSSIAKINACSSLDELKSVCRELTNTLGNDYKQEIVKLYGIKKGDIENGSN
jgi:hypothetical protein